MKVEPGLVIFDEYSIFCEYWYADLPKVLSDIELLMTGLMPGDVLRLSTVHLEALSAVPAWCRATGNNIIGQNSMCEYPLGLHYFFDIERGASEANSSNMLTSEGI
jgi:hypothetical protein